MSPKAQSAILRIALYGGIGANAEYSGMGIGEQPVKFILMMIMVIIISLINFSDGFKMANDRWLKELGGKE
jgi:hypothetical protein